MMLQSRPALRRVSCSCSRPPFQTTSLHDTILTSTDTAMFRPGGKSTAMASDGKVKVHTTWPDGSEQVEEYDQKTEQLLSRKMRRKSSVGGEGPWEFEIGEAPTRPSDVGIVENPDNPICVRRDTRRQFQWRIRNISFPVEVYLVTVSPEEHTVTIRTSNKKWYKKLLVPDTQRLGCQVWLNLMFPRPTSH
jgi:protein DPCD